MSASAHRIVKWIGAAVIVGFTIYMLSPVHLSIPTGDSPDIAAFLSNDAPPRQEQNAAPIQQDVETSSTTTQLSPRTDPPIPRKFWQIHFGNPSLTSDAFPLLPACLASWITRAQDYTYTLLSRDGGDRLVSSAYTSRPDLQQLYSSLESWILQADFLRYLVLAAEGGIYSDLDTEALQQLDEWIPSVYRSTARLVVGIEYDQLNDDSSGAMSLPLQFCQWTLAAAPGHPLLLNMVDRAATNIRTLLAARTSTTELVLTDNDVLRATGPVAWSKAVLQHLATIEGRDLPSSELSGLTEPKLFGDVLVVPINWFASNVPHSGADASSPEARIRHHFRGSWRALGGWSKKE